MNGSDRGHASAEDGHGTRLWQRVPVVLRAFVAGSFVLTAGGVCTGPLIIGNAMLWPQIPWSAAGLTLWMAIFWRYARGQWWPKSTASARRAHLRANRLTAAVWRLALVTGAFGVSWSISLQWAVARFAPLDYALPEVLRPFPPVSLLVILLTLSAVAGIIEEAAFRGYMQTPIEARHGRLAAILLVSGVFGLAHLSDWQPDMTWARMVFILAAGVFYGLLASTVGSILPGIVIHAGGNMIGILWIWWLGGARVQDKTPSDFDQILLDPRFGFACLVSVLSALGAVWSFRRLFEAVGSLTPREALRQAPRPQLDGRDAPPRRD